MIERIGEIKESILHLAQKTRENGKRIVSTGLAVGGLALVAAGCGGGDSQPNQGPKLNCLPEGGSSQLSSYNSSGSTLAFSNSPNDACNELV